MEAPLEVDGDDGNGRENVKRSGGHKKSPEERLGYVICALLFTVITVLFSSLKLGDVIKKIELKGRWLGLCSGRTRLPRRV